MPQYKKVFDVGTYAGVSGFTRVGIPTLRTPGSGGKQVAKSLRFRSANSAYLSRTPGTTGDRQKFTYSAWIKRGTLATSVSLFSAYNNSGTTDSDWFNVTFLSGASPVDSININGWNTNYIRTLAIFSDPSAWYHIVVAVDTTSATSTITGTSTDRIRLYVNGIQIKTFNIANAPTQNLNTPINSTSYQHRIGSLNWSSAAQYFDGYMSEVYLIDGTALDPTSFGEYNSDNIWVPKAYSGSFSGTNSFYLDFSDVGTTTAGGTNSGYGKDLSGKGTPNNWTTNNFGTTSNAATYDSMIDSPTDWDNSGVITGNYATLNPAQTTPSGSFSEGNLKFTTAAAWGGSRATIAIPATGKWYAEFTLGSTSSNSAQGDVGIFPTTLTNDYDWTGAYGLECNNGFFLVTNGSYSSNAGVTIAGGSVMQIAVDADAGKVWFGKGNAWYDTYNTTNGNPSSGTNPSGSSINFAAVQYAMGIKTAGNNWTANFGQRPFVHTPPTGFKALNTKNITRPTDANMWFYGDTPDLMWIKNRSATADHSLTDTVRGVGLGLTTNVTPAAENGAQDVAEMNKFGMTLIGASSRTTAASNSFVYWAWKGGGAAVTNTQGSITSQVSANISSGFSVVTYTGDGSASKTVGHGLNAIPSMVIMRKRNVTSDWYVAHYSLNNSYNFAWHMFLNTTGAVSSNNDPYFLSSGNTSSVIEVLNYSGSNGGNQSGTNYVAYCWTPIAGYSSFGSYTGNGSASGDGPFVYTGFRPRFIMIKRYDTGSAENWEIWDSARPGYNATALQLFANTTGNESDGTARPCIIDFLSNGFKLRGSNSEMNTLSSTYIYAAFAEHPFKISRAR